MITLAIIVLVLGLLLGLHILYVVGCVLLVGGGVLLILSLRQPAHSRRYYF